MRINVQYTVYTAVYECVLGALRRIQTLACHIRVVCVWLYWTCLNDRGHWFRNADQEAQPASSLQGSEWTDMSKHQWLQLHLYLATSHFHLHQPLQSSPDMLLWRWLIFVFHLCRHSPLQVTKDPDCQGMTDVFVLSRALNCPEHFLGKIVVMDDSAISVLISVWWTRFCFT